MLRRPWLLYSSHLTAVLALAAIAYVATPVTKAQSTPPAPAEPDDTIYTSPYTFDSFTKGGTIEPDEGGPNLRRAQRWQLLGGPTPLALTVSMSEAAAAERGRYAQQLAGAAGAAGLGHWTSLGPTSENHWQNGTQPNPQINSGRPNQILVHPTNPDIVYLLAATGGMWRTTNFTQPKPDWTPLTDGFAPAAGAAAFGRNPSTIYFGAGDAFDGWFGGYVARSFDGGLSWGPATQLNAGVTLDLKVDSSAAADIVLVGTDNGLFRSVNAGASWTQPFSGAIVWSIVQTSAGWLASVESYAGVGSLYRSADHGATWSAVPNGGNVYTGAGRTTLGVGAPGDAVVYAYAANTGDAAQLDLFRSADGGLNWTAANLASKTPTNFDYFQQDMDLMGGQAFYNQMVLVDPTDSSRNTVYIGGQLSSAKSTNGGGTWALTSTWVPLRGPAAIVGNVPYVHADFHCAAFIATPKQNYVLVGSDGGIFVSTDGGRTWDDRKNGGLTTHQIYAMSVNAAHTDELLVGLQDNGTLYRRPNSTSFDGVIGGDGFGTGWSQATDAVSIGSVYYNAFYRSLNNPPNTQTKFEGASAGISRGEASFFTPLTTPAATADPFGQTFFTWTATRVYRTTNAAGLWNVIGRSGVNLPASRTFQGQHGLSVSPVDINRVAATVGGGRVEISLDGGATWTERQLIGVGTYAGINVATAWANTQVLYVGSGSTATNRAHVVKTTDAGQTWQVADGGLPRLPIAKILTDPTDPTGNTAYVANIVGVYRTTDGGTSWTLFGNGLPLVDVRDLYMPADGSFLRAATYGRGVWEIPLK